MPSRRPVGHVPPPTGGEDLPGLDLPALRRHLMTRLPDIGSTPSVSAELVVGGKSNLTYVLRSGEHRWILRRPPVGHLLATAHDMNREYRVMSALATSAVPVPAVIDLCEDAAVIGAPFYLMEFVDGTPYRHAEQLRPLGAVRTARIARRMIDTLADLHAVDPEEVGLGDFGRPEGFLERQVRRWRRQFDDSWTRPLPLVDELHQQLLKAVPSTTRTGLVHGDYRLDNLLIDRHDEVAAVVDWEMATVGDPVTDLALLHAYQSMASLGAGYVSSSVSSAEGFPSPDELLQRYAEVSGTDLDGIGFYLGLAHFKLAGIFEGIHHRHANGQTVDDADVGSTTSPLLERGLELLQEHR